MVNADEILPEAEQHRMKWKDYVRDAANIFHNEEGELFERSDAIEKLTEELEIEEDTAQQTLSELVSDIVDPVVQVPTNGEKYIGVVEYHEYDGAYGYREFNDVGGEANRVVCARCVETASRDKEVTHATSGSGSFDEDADFDELYDTVVKHYEQSHDVIPESVETGASLLSGTTIGGNTAYHGGNASTNLVTSVNGSTGDVSVSGTPSGVITMWSGTTADIPSGWTLCDGTDEAPDLRDKFIAGAGGQYSAGQTGGADSVALSESEMPSHDHTGSTNTTGSHTHSLTLGSTAGDRGGWSAYDGSNEVTNTVDSAGAHSHSLNINNAGSDAAHENRPPFYALAFIMKV